MAALERGNGKPVSSGSNNGVVVGGGSIVSNPVHVQERKLKFSRTTRRPSDKSTEINEVLGPETIPGVVKEAASSESGPWGGDGGKPWNDEVFSGVRKISLYKGKGEAIYCIKIEYDRNGQSVKAKRHGPGTAEGHATIIFDYPREVLTSVRGYYDPREGGVIKSLTFCTNEKTHGPYGEENGTFFTSPETGRKIVGFHGRSDFDYLNAIGVHLQQWSKASKD